MSFEENNYALSQYLKDQENYSKRNFTLSSIDELTNSVKNSQAIFLGDFHTFDQNIRNVLRIIKVLLSENKNCTLALEMVNAKYQLFIDAFLEGHITDLEFLESINYHESWRFPWSHYKLIFELAKQFQIKVIGINKSGSLSHRDEYAANRLHELFEEDPDRKLLVLYGELHITKDKIPALLKLKYPQARQAIIHQNLDEVYWKLTKNNIEQGIVSFTESEFCIVSAPPWIKYESMIYWYENLCDDPEFDIHEYIIENGKKIFSDETSENFVNICLDLSKYLHLNLTADDIEDFNLYDHTNLSTVEEKIQESSSTPLLKLYEYLISNSYSFKLPKGSSFYCSNYSMNRISYLAGMHIFHHYLDQSNIDTHSILNSKSTNSKFTLFTFESMFAYFFSKIINPHRKCDMFADLKSKETNSPFVLKMALNILESDTTLKLAGVPLKDVYEMSLMIGHILGEYLYDELFSGKQNLSLTEDFLLIGLSANDFLSVKRKLLSGRNFKEDKKRYF